MSEKKCPTCGSNMGKGASTDEKVKVLYECWCGEVLVEFYTEDEELPKSLIEKSNSTSALITV